MAPGDFIREKIERFVFLDSAAESGTGLHASVGLLGGNRLETCLGVGDKLHREGILRLNSAVPQEAEKIAVNFVGAGFRYDVDDSAHGPTVLRHVVAGDDL